jgi:hypothetical protein
VKKELSTQGAVKLGGKTPVTTTPETDPVDRDDVNPVGSKSKISESLLGAVVGVLAKNAALKAAANAGINPIVLASIYSAYRASKKKKGKGTKSDARQQPKPGAVTVAKAPPSAKPKPPPSVL